MNLNTEIVDSYLAGENMEKFRNHWIYETVGQGEYKEKNIFTMISFEYKDNIQEIYDEIRQCLISFEPFNRKLWNVLFPDWIQRLQEIEVYLIVGLPEPNDATVIKDPSGKNVVILDLGCWKKYLGHTDITKLVCNLLTHEYCHICIQNYNPIIDKDYEDGSYLDKFNSLVFNEGLAHLLSFCEDISSYDWNSNKIVEVKSKSLCKLKEAITEKEKEKQDSYLYDAD